MKMRGKKKDYKKFLLCKSCMFTPSKNREKGGLIDSAIFYRVKT